MARLKIFSHISYRESNLLNGGIGIAGIQGQLSVCLHIDCLQNLTAKQRASFV